MWNLITKNKEYFVKSLSAFSIANFIIWIGNIFRVIITGSSLVPVFLLDLDLGILFITISLFQIYSRFDGIMLSFSLIGWALASIYTKQNTSEKDFTRVMLYASILPSMLLSIIAIIFAFNIVLGFFYIIEFFLILFFVILFAIVINIYSMILVLPGILIGSFISKQNKIEPVQAIYPNYLLLIGYVPPTPNEIKKFCPYRMKSNPGCAFFGIQGSK